VSTDEFFPHANVCCGSFYLLNFVCQPSQNTRVYLYLGIDEEVILEVEVGEEEVMVEVGDTSQLVVGQRQMQQVVAVLQTLDTG